jgi:hypothetical protein
MKKESQTFSSSLPDIFAMEKSNSQVLSNPADSSISQRQKPLQSPSEVCTVSAHTKLDNLVCC